MKDSCDGSGLNTVDSSKGSFPLMISLGLSNDVVQLSYISVPWYRMSGSPILVDSRFLPQKVWFSNNVTFGNLFFFKNQLTLLG